MVVDLYSNKSGYAIAKASSCHDLRIYLDSDVPMPTRRSVTGGIVASGLARVFVT